MLIRFWLKESTLRRLNPLSGWPTLESYLQKTELNLLSRIIELFHCSSVFKRPLQMENSLNCRVVHEKKAVWSPEWLFVLLLDQFEHKANVYLKDPSVQARDICICIENVWEKNNPVSVWYNAMNDRAALWRWPAVTSPQLEPARRRHVVTGSKLIL